MSIRITDVTPAVLARDYVARKAQVLTPEDFGAKGDGATVFDASITNNSPVLGTSYSFTSADVGKKVVVLPAAGSSQATFATSILSVSGGVATLAANAPYTGSGLECTFASDDSTALQSWLSDSSALTRLLPGKTYGFTVGLTLGGWYDVLCAQGGTLKVMAQLANPAGWPGSARTVATAIATSFTTLNTLNAGWYGGVLDCSLLCDDGFAPKWVRSYEVDRLVVRAPKVRMFSLGDAATSGTSYQAILASVLGWRDFGVVPTSALALNGTQITTTATGAASTDLITANGHGLVNGQEIYFSAATGGTGVSTGVSNPYYIANATTNTFQLKTLGSSAVVDITGNYSAMTIVAMGIAGSVGVYIDANCTDSTITGKSVMMGAQVGYETHGGDTAFEGAHCWARSSIGWMDYGFDDYAGHNSYTSTYSDTPRYAGYRQRSTYGKYVGATAYNNSSYGSDNQAIGFMLDSSSGHQFVGCKTEGADSSHRYARDFGRPDGSQFNPVHPLTGNMVLNVVTSHNDTTPPVSVNVQAGSYSIFSADANGRIESTSATPVTITLNSNIPVGNEVTITQTGAGKVTLSAPGFTLTAPLSGQWSQLSASATATGSTDAITVTGHGLSVGDAVLVAAVSGSVGLTAGQIYYIQSVVDANNFKLAASSGGAAIDITADTTTRLLVPPSGVSSVGTRAQGSTIKAYRAYSAVYWLSGDLG